MSVAPVEITTSSKPNLAKMKGKEDFFTLSKYVFPIGKDKPVITLPEVKIE